MSSELIEMDNNEQGQDIFLTMSADGSAYLSVGDSKENTFQNYYLSVDDDGIRRAETIISALQGWVEHIKESGLKR